MNKIILVDDHSLFREGIKLLIENEGYGEIIAEAENGQQFMDLLKIHQPDLVIMDIEMPVMNGLDATREAIKLFPNLRILILTMLSEKANYIDLVNAGALGFVLKTSGKQEFEKAIKTITGGGSYFSNELLRQLIMQQHEKTAKTNDASHSDFSTISKREKEVLHFLCNGLTVTEIAEKLYVSPKTIETHRSALLKKTNTKNTINLVLCAIKNKIVEV
jgi:DNA-binding NarL/FixJ family response regulator